MRREPKESYGRYPVPTDVVVEVVGRLCEERPRALFATATKVESLVSSFLRSVPF